MDLAQAISGYSAHIKQMGENLASATQFSLQEPGANLQEIVRNVAEKSLANGKYPVALVSLAEGSQVAILHSETYKSLVKSFKDEAPQMLGNLQNTFAASKKIIVFANNLLTRTNLANVISSALILSGAALTIYHLYQEAIQLQQAKPSEAKEEIRFSKSGLTLIAAGTISLLFTTFLTNQIGGLLEDLGQHL